MSGSSSVTQTPEWWRDSILYHIYPLGCCGAPFHNNVKEPGEQRLLSLSSPRWLDHLQNELHVTAVYIGPLFESATHGYDTVDYFKVDRRLGTNDDFRELVKAYHARGIKVIVDAVFNHVGRNFFAFKDLLEKKSDSKYKEWFSGVRFDGKHQGGDGFHYDCWNNVQSLVKLDVMNVDVQKLIFSAVRYWRNEWGVDGLRLDAADVVNKDFWRMLMKDPCTEPGPSGENFFILGEITNGSCTPWIGPGMFHSITNYECYKGLFSSHNDMNLFEIAHSLERLFSSSGPCATVALCNFADNHDVNRIASTLCDLRHLSTIYMLLYCMPGFPTIYYGSEYGMVGRRTSGPLADVPLRPNMKIDEYQNLADAKDSQDYAMVLMKILECLGTIRQSQEGRALREGRFSNVSISNLALVMRRQLQSESVFLAVNISDQHIKIRLPVEGQKVYDLLNRGKVFNKTSDCHFSISVPPFWGSIMLCRSQSSPDEVSPSIASQNPLDNTCVVTALAAAQTRSRQPSMSPQHHNKHHHRHDLHGTMKCPTPPSEVNVKLPPISSLSNRSKLSSSPILLPDWAQDSLFYHINALGQCGAPKRQASHDCAHENGSGTAQEVPCLSQLASPQWLSHLESLGVGVVCIGPVLQSKSHGYDVVDLKMVDKRLGDTASMAGVVQRYHSQGIKVILEVGGWPKLFQQTIEAGKGQEEATKEMLDAVRYWVNDLGVDGIRVDAADQMHDAENFWERLSKFVKDDLLQGSDFFLLGDVHGDVLRWANSLMFHSVTNYEIVKNIWSSVESCNLFEIIHNIQRQSDSNNGVYRDVPLYCFLDGHNQNRVASLLRDPSKLRVLYVLLLTMPGIPGIYYGSEFGLTGKKLSHSHFADEPLRPSIDVCELTANPPNAGILGICQKLGGFRKTAAAIPIRRGTFTPCLTQNCFAVYTRQDAERVVYIAVNASDKDVPIVLLEVRSAHSVMSNML
eukprot:GHVQ01022777.1.p1 GENE.GHVQ01022777.1~~GHVQ01022777.1.p1  ORF type:complete len:968 (+),score=82.88 GHVQ01022777.1:216-3119(+)